MGTNGARNNMTAVGKAADAQGLSPTVALATAAAHGGRTRALYGRAPVDGELGTTLVGRGTRKALPSDVRSTTGLEATRKERLANASKGGQSVVVATASHVAMLAACLLRDRGGRGPLCGAALAQAGVLATLDWLGGRQVCGRGFPTFFGLALFLLALVATSAIRGGRFAQVSVVPGAASSEHHTHKHCR